MNSNDLSSLIEQLVGAAPEGLEWMNYLFSWLLLFFGLTCVLIFILKLFKLFDKT